MSIHRKISKVIIIAMCAALIGSCGTPDYKKTDEVMESLVSAITESDKEAVKSVFSESALGEAEELDERIDLLFELGKSGRIEWQQGAYSETKSKNGHSVVKKKYAKYLVTIDDVEYIFFLIHCLRDDNEPQNVGIYMIQVLLPDNIRKYFDWGHEKICPGIYPVIG